MNKKKEFIRDKHYYLEGDRVIFTSLFLFERGECCGSKCRHCPFSPKHTKGSVKLQKLFAYLKENS